MFPGIIANVHYERHTRQWVISGDGVKPAALDITDRSAPDDFILTELATWPNVYQARIRRHP